MPGDETKRGLRFITPADVSDQPTGDRDAFIAFCTMRDKPLVFRREWGAEITPAPVGMTCPWIKRDIELPYADEVVAISKDRGSLRVEFDASGRTLRGVLTSCLALCEWLYGTTYRQLWGLSQQMIELWPSPGAAMTYDYPRDRTFLSWSDEGPEESFSLWTPGGAEASATVKRSLVVQGNGLVRWLWKLDELSVTPGVGSEHLEARIPQIVERRNRLAAYSWSVSGGISAPIGWRQIDDFRETP